MTPTTDAKQILLQILEIIVFSKEREFFANDFINLCAQQAMADVFEKMTDEQADAVQQKLAGNDSADQIQAALAEFFTNGEYTAALKKSCDQMLSEFITSVVPSLSG